jgi:hypothetical protein
MSTWGEIKDHIRDFWTDAISTVPTNPSPLFVNSNKSQSTPGHPKLAFMQNLNLPG